MIKQKIRKGDSSQLDREYRQNHTANTHNCEKLNFFPFISEISQGCLFLTLLINIVLVVSQCNKARKGNRKHPDQKGRYKTVPICK